MLIEGPQKEQFLHRIPPLEDMVLDSFHKFFYSVKEA